MINVLNEYQALINKKQFRESATKVHNGAQTDGYTLVKKQYTL